MFLFGQMDLNGFNVCFFFVSCGHVLCAIEMGVWRGQIKIYIYIGTRRECVGT